MPAYYMVLNATLFHGQIRPILAASWRLRTFEPCRSLCAALVAKASVQAPGYGTEAAESLLARVGQGLSFDRRFWRPFVGELLVLAAEAMPEIETTPETVCCLLGCADDPVSREQFDPIQQAYFGARDLTFGSACYRPDHAGYNDRADVARLAAYLASIRPEDWSESDLKSLSGVTTDEERVEELEFAREWFPALQTLYQQAEEQGHIMVCEVL